MALRRIFIRVLRFFCQFHSAIAPCWDRLSVILLEHKIILILAFGTASCFSSRSVSNRKQFSCFMVPVALTSFPLFKGLEFIYYIGFEESPHDWWLRISYKMKKKLPIQRNLDRGHSFIIKICEKNVRVTGVAVNKPSTSISQGRYIISKGQLNLMQWIVPYWSKVIINVATLPLNMREILGSYLGKQTEYHVWSFPWDFLDKCRETDRHSYKDVNLRVLRVFIQGVPGEMCQTSTECSLR